MSNTESDLKRSFVREMFDDIYGRYDVLNTVLSLGQDMRWRRKAISDVPNKGWVIDLCAGGGELTQLVMSRSEFAGQVVLADISPNMLALSRRIIGRNHRGRCFAVVCDVQNLPFKESISACAISGFSLRNLSDLEEFSSETRRVLSGGGIARLLEIGHPRNRLLATMFECYFYRLSPLIARLFTSKDYAYRYLPASLKAFPAQDKVAVILGKGWAHCTYDNILGGIAAIYKLSRD